MALSCCGDMQEAVSATVQKLIEDGAEIELEFGVLGQMGANGMNFPTTAKKSESLMTAPVPSTYRQGVNTNDNDKCVLSPPCNLILPPANPACWYAHRPLTFVQRIENIPGAVLRYRSMGCLLYIPSDSSGWDSERLRVGCVSSAASARICTFLYLLEDAAYVCMHSRLATQQLPADGKTTVEHVEVSISLTSKAFENGSELRHGNISDIVAGRIGAFREGKVYLGEAVAAVIHAIMEQVCLNCTAHSTTNLYPFARI